MLFCRAVMTVAVAGLRMKVVVGVVVLALLSGETAENDDTSGSWMRSCWPWPTMPLPEVAFTRRVPAGLWVPMLPEVREERVLALEVISWRMGVWAETTEVAGTRDWVVRGLAGVTGERRRNI